MNGNRAELTEEFHQLVNAILDAPSVEYYQQLYAYCGDLREPAASAKYVRHVMDLFDLAACDIRGMTVLDAGCGSGFTSILCGLLGAAEVHGMDIHPGTLNPTGAYTHLLPSDLAARLRFDYGDASCMPYDDETFDVLLSVEAVSHYLFVDGFIAEAARVLKPGGVLIISDGNNGLNPVIRRRTYDVWGVASTGAVQAHAMSKSGLSSSRRTSLA